MKRIWKIYKYAAITVFSLLVVDVLIVLFFGAYRPAIQKADAIVVLGAAINTPALYNRSLEGLRLYEAGDANVIVASGGRVSSKDISEAQYIERSIQSKQNPKTFVPIILEDQSHDTYENIKNTKEKIGSGKSIIIVSDKFHLARAVIIAKRLGFGPVYWSSPAPTYYKGSELVFYYAREVLAIIAYLPKFVMG